MTEMEPKRGRGKPRVVADQTLKTHGVAIDDQRWEWLKEQSGGASQWVRDMIDQMRLADRRRKQGPFDVDDLVCLRNDPGYGTFSVVEILTNPAGVVALGIRSPNGRVLEVHPREVIHADPGGFA